MEQAGTVDSEVQGSISNLVSALGGVDPSTQQYKLGDESLACLRDLRKWLQNYDAKYDRLEVACAIANTTLITSDIPHILGTWQRTWRKKRDPYLDRVALACLELLTPLTWPVEIVGAEASAQHFTQSMFLKQSQSKYKRALLTHSSHCIMAAVVRLAAPAMSIPHRQRESRDEGILTLACSFFRNILAIDSSDDESRALTIKEYERQKVLALLITLGAGLSTSVGASFDAQDTLVQECLYYILKGVSIPRLFELESDPDPLLDAFNENLKSMLETETEMNRAAFKPTRHSRFGTMVAMNEGGGNQVSISGQRGVSGNLTSTLVKIDGGKKWRRPVLRGALDEKEDFVPKKSGINTDAEVLALLREFVSDFLDTSFNCIFSKIRLLIERQNNSRISKPFTVMQFCYLVGWFIEAERTRSKLANKSMDFKLVGSCLNRNSLTTVMSVLRRGTDPGEWHNTDLVHAAMISLRQILTCIRDMSHSGDNSNSEVAEGLKARLFYEESWLKLLSQLPRTSHRRSLAYASETIASTHVLLKMLEEYSKQHTVLFVRMRQRKKKHQTNGTPAADWGHEDEESDENSDAEAERNRLESIRVTSERKFSFEKFILKYINGPTIDTYERVLSSYKEISQQTVLQILSFFRRTFAKTKCRALFYRMSLMRLLLDLVSEGGLPQKSDAYVSTNQFLKYYVQKFVETSTQMPSLHIQLNESISPQDAFYYDHGGRVREKFKPPKYEFTLTDKAKEELDLEFQAAVMIAGLIDIGKEAYLPWLEESVLAYLGKDTEERNRKQLLTMDKDKIKGVHNDALLRLFLRFLGLVVNTTAGEIYFPPTIDRCHLVESLEWMRKFQNEVVQFEGGKVAIDFIKIDGEPDRDEESPQPHRPTTTRSVINSGLEDAEVPEVPRVSGPSSNELENHSGAPESKSAATSSDSEDDYDSNDGKRNYSEAFTSRPVASLSPGHDEEPITSFRKRKAIDDDEDDD